MVSILHFQVLKNIAELQAGEVRNVAAGGFSVRLYVSISTYISVFCYMRCAAL
jgi:hypothetical protein